MYYEIYKDGTGNWRWRLKAENHQIIASGESYVNKSDCMTVIGMIKGSKDAPIHDLNP